MMNQGRRFIRCLFTICFVFSITYCRHVAVASEKQDNDNGRPNHHEKTENKYDEGEDHDVKVGVSPECAAVVLVGGTAIGSVAAMKLLPSMLMMIGFTSLGVSSGSFASWWQSTMPLIPTGSLFATLQSIAMSSGGVGSGTIVIGAAAGGAASAVHLQKLCEIVDSVDPDSPPGKVITGAVDTEKIVSSSKEWVFDGFVQSDDIQRAKQQFDKYIKEFVQSDQYQQAKDWLDESSQQLSDWADRSHKEFVESDQYKQAKELFDESRKKFGKWIDSSSSNELLFMESDEYKKAKELFDKSSTQFRNWVDRSRKEFVESNQYKQAKDWFTQTKSEFMKSETIQDWIDKPEKKKFRNVLDWVKEQL